MNQVQRNTIDQMVARFKRERNLDATYGVRMSGNFAYVQFHVKTPSLFPELRVGDRGGWWSDAQCRGGEIRSFPNPAMDSLLYADEFLAKQTRRSGASPAQAFPQPPRVNSAWSSGGKTPSLIGPAASGTAGGDPWLQVCHVWNDESAMSNALQAALGRNKTYRAFTDDSMRPRFRREWARLLRREAADYGRPVSDEAHCKAIVAISDEMSKMFPSLLSEGRLRIGTSQKAFNLYLKFRWRLTFASEPPHCPIDSIVLGNAGIYGSWTLCDDIREYISWINAIRSRCRPVSLAQWEYSVWLASEQIDSGCSHEGFRNC